MTVLELEREIRAETELASELAQYAGEWVAVDAHKVIGHAGTLDELLEKIGEETARSAEGIFQVSASDTACYF